MWYFNIVQKCWHNGILVRECVHNYPYPAMPIFSRRYLLASRDVVKYVGLDEPDRGSQGF